MKSSQPITQFFEPHWSLEKITDGLRNELIKGALRLNTRNYKEAYVTHPKLDSDILVYDKHINRALFDDIVVIQIFPKSYWKVTDTLISEIDQLHIEFKRAALEQKHPKNIYEDRTVTVESAIKMCPDLFQNKLGWSLQSAQLHLNTDFPDQCINWWKYFQRTGKVVGILSALNSRLCVGKVAFDNDLGVARLSPLDNRYPRLNVPLDNLPTDFMKRTNDYKDVKFIAKIGDWPETSERPNGEISQCLKDLPTIEQETLRILAENGISCADEYGELQQTSPPPVEPISELDLRLRRDLRTECIFSIDPKTARDLDDALHIRSLPPDSTVEKGEKLFEVGVHIADVTHYVHDHSDIDEVARRRCTTVYMVHKAIPMLPRHLCEQLCSLTPGEDKLAYSVVYKVAALISDKGSCAGMRVLDTWIGRTIIRSCCQLSYEDAQNVIDSPPAYEWTDSDFGPVYGDHSRSQIADCILQLHELSRQMQEQRHKEGSLAIFQSRLGFILNEAKDGAVGYRRLEIGTANSLIEEWMLRANMSVAAFLHRHLPETALLRFHPAPTSQAVENVNKQLITMGWAHLQLDSGSSKEFMELTEEFDHSDIKYLALLNVCNKALQLAQYICSNNCPVPESPDMGMLHHFALNVPLYTHFTSPIRRYPDMIVHRQISQVLMRFEQEKIDLGCGDCDHEKVEWLARTCLSENTNNAALNDEAQLCNKRKKDAKAADEASGAMFYSLFVEKCGPFTEDALVLGVLDKAFDVLLTETGFIRRVYINQFESVTGSSFSGTKKKLTLTWRQADHCTQAGHYAVTTIISQGASVDLQLRAESKGRSDSLPVIRYILPQPSCNLCWDAGKPRIRPNNISTFQAQSDSQIDDYMLYKMVDDI